MAILSMLFATSSKDRDEMSMAKVLSDKPSNCMSYLDEAM